MKKEDQTFQNCLQLAKDYVASKERANHYLFTAIDDNWDTEVCCLNILSDDEVKMIRDLKGKYGVEEFVKHLDEVYEDPDFIHDLTGGCEIIAIDLDTIYHKYRIGIHELRPDGTVFDIAWSAELTDEDYTQLVAYHIFDEHFTMNLLRHYDRKLYDRVMWQADLHYTDFDCDGLIVDTPYLVTLDEAKEDAEKIIEKQGIERTRGYRGMYLNC